jgi:hypothetical protein
MCAGDDSPRQQRQPSAATGTSVGRAAASRAARKIGEGRWVSQIVILPVYHAPAPGVPAPDLYGLSCAVVRPGIAGGLCLR